MLSIPTLRNVSGNAVLSLALAIFIASILQGCDKETVIASSPSPMETVIASSPSPICKEQQHVKLSAAAISVLQSKVKDAGDLEEILKCMKVALSADAIRLLWEKSIRDSDFKEILMGMKVQLSADAIRVIWDKLQKVTVFDDALKEPARDFKVILMNMQVRLSDDAIHMIWDRVLPTTDFKVIMMQLQKRLTADDIRRLQPKRPSSPKEGLHFKNKLLPQEAGHHLKVPHNSQEGRDSRNALQLQPKVKRNLRAGRALATATLRFNQWTSVIKRL